MEKEKLEAVSAALDEICYKRNGENGAADRRASGGLEKFFCFVLREKIYFVCSLYAC